MTEDKVIHPFAYRAHTHKLGLVNSAYRVSVDNDAKQTWTEIGRRSPQLPQMFYPVTQPVIIKNGDIIAARCTMKNPSEHTVYIGPTSDDEMCNFYFMYYVDGDHILDDNMCVSSGPPNWYFENFVVKTSSFTHLYQRRN
jgi:peptidylglycine monooxygenase